MAKVSVIVPVYEVEKHLEGCLQSILNQTLSNIEIVCVNDATTDNSVSIVKSLRETDKRIRLVHHDRNIGLGAAWNTGLRYSSGEFVKFVNGDDRLSPSALEDLMLAAHMSGADWSFSSFLTLAQKRETLQRPFYTDAAHTRAAAGGFSFFDYKLDPTILSDIYSHGWLGLWRKSIITDSAAQFSEQSSYFNDEFFFRYAFASSSFAYLDRPLCSTRAHQAQLIGTHTSEEIFEIFDLVKHNSNLFKHLPASIRDSMTTRLMLRSIWERSKLLEFSSEYAAEYYKLSAEHLRVCLGDLAQTARDLNIPDEDLHLLLGRHVIEGREGAQIDGAGLRPSMEKDSAVSTETFLSGSGAVTARISDASLFPEEHDAVQAEAGNMEQTKQSTKQLIKRLCRPVLTILTRVLNGVTMRAAEHTIGHVHRAAEEIVTHIYRTAENTHRSVNQTANSTAEVKQAVVEVNQTAAAVLAHTITTERMIVSIRARIEALETQVEKLYIAKDQPKHTIIPDRQIKKPQKRQPIDVIS